MATTRRTAKKAPAKKTAAKVATKTEADILADIDRRTSDMADGHPDTEADTPTATVIEPGTVSTTDVRTPRDRRTPKTLDGRVVVGEEIDPNAERALRDPKVAADYAEIKSGLHKYMELDQSRTEALKFIARKLMDLRAHFKEPGSRGRMTDWNGSSLAYSALANLVYRDAGLIGPEADSTKRAVRYHVEALKRELVPRKHWDHYGVSEITQGQRQMLAKKFQTEHTSVGETTQEVSRKALAGEVTGSQLVSLAKQIDRGVSVYTAEALRTLTPKQRSAFKERMESLRQHADELLRELDSLD
ncbi:hypothetical protein AB0P37_08540 [Streptomyces antimycoticus]|uniref:hypothetical protein n=1 Tax=Streptomyces antimycoticus TaxID=68175 RepID=UPI003415E5FF